MTTIATESACTVTLRRSATDPHPQVVQYRADFLVDRPGGPGPITVGWADLVLLARWDQATFDALEDLSWDLAVYAHLLRGGYYEILRQLHGRDPRETPGAAHPAPGVVLVDQVHIEGPWRGRCLGLRGTGLALRELQPQAGFALLYPMRPGLAAPGDRADSYRTLSRYWSRLGFGQSYERHLVLDLTTDGLDTALAALTPVAH